MALSQSPLKTVKILSSVINSMLASAFIPSYIYENFCFRFLNLWKNYPTVIVPWGDIFKGKKNPLRKLRKSWPRVFTIIFTALENLIHQTITCQTHIYVRTHIFLCIQRRKKDWRFKHIILFRKTCRVMASLCHGLERIDNYLDYFIYGLF